LSILIDAKEPLFLMLINQYREIVSYEAAMGWGMRAYSLKNDTRGFASFSGTGLVPPYQTDPPFVLNGHGI